MTETPKIDKFIFQMMKNIKNNVISTKNFILFIVKNFKEGN